MILPILDAAGSKVIGTMDIESDKPDTFTAETQEFLARSVAVIRALW